VLRSLKIKFLTSVFPLNCLKMSIKVAVVEDEKHYNNALKKIIDNA
jgi:hypothetical protein